MPTKKLFNKIPIYCHKDNCMDEILGLLAIVLGMGGYVTQFIKTEQSFDVSSFSIYALILGCISELLFVVQGLMKNSYTIAFTRFITFLGFVSYVVIWVMSKYSKNKDNYKSVSVIPTRVV
jgi:FtsH-binding integral membrane protein